MTATKIDVRLAYTLHKTAPNTAAGRAEYAIETGLALFTDTEDPRALQLLLATVRPDLTMADLISLAGDLVCVSALVAHAEHNASRQTWESYKAEYAATLRAFATRPAHPSYEAAIVSALELVNAFDAYPTVDELAQRRAARS